MGELKIRAVRSPSGEAESRYAVIDTFEEITNGKPYFCGCEVFTVKYNNDMTIRGIEMEKLKLDKKDDSNPIEACEDDIFEKVDIPLYIGLAQALKNDGYVFNKRLARLYKNPNIKTNPTER